MTEKPRNVSDASGRLWLSLEMSDDEDRRHLNVDTPSLYKWRHTLRKERSELLKTRRTQLERRLLDDHEAAQELSAAMIKSPGRQSFQPYVTAVDVLRRKTELDERKLLQTRIAAENLPLALGDLIDRRQSKTASRALVYDCSSTDQGSFQGTQTSRRTARENESEVHAFGWLQKTADNVRYLTIRPYLLNTATVEELSRMCLSLAMQEKFHALKHVASQFIFLWQVYQMSKLNFGNPIICLHVVANRLNLARTLSDREFSPPISSLFRAPETNKCVVRYLQHYNDSVHKFIWYIREQSSRRIREQLSKRSLEAEQAFRIMTLDPVSVLESLPERLREGFENQDVTLINYALRKMGPDQAKYHMERCVRSNLWRPDASDKATDMTTGLAIRHRADQEKEKAKGGVRDFPGNQNRKVPNFHRPSGVKFSSPRNLNPRGSGGHGEECHGLRKSSARRKKVKKKKIDESHASTTDD